MRKETAERELKSKKTFADHVLERDVALGRRQVLIEPPVLPSLAPSDRRAHVVDRVEDAAVVTEELALEIPGIEKR